MKTIKGDIKTQPLPPYKPKEPKEGWVLRLIFFLVGLILLLTLCER